MDDVSVMLSPSWARVTHNLLSITNVYTAGNGVNCLRVGPHKAIEFFTFETLKRLLLSSSDPLHLQLAAPLSGGAAGIAGTLATYPLELIRTRITIQVGEKEKWLIGCFSALVIQ